MRAFLVIGAGIWNQEEEPWLNFGMKVRFL